MVCVGAQTRPWIHSLDMIRVDYVSLRLQFYGNILGMVTYVQVVATIAVRFPLFPNGLEST